MIVTLKFNFNQNFAFCNIHKDTIRKLEEFVRKWWFTMLIFYLPKFQIFQVNNKNTEFVGHLTLKLYAFTLCNK